MLAISFILFAFKKGIVQCIIYIKYLRTDKIPDFYNFIDTNTRFEYFARFTSSEHVNIP